MLPENINASSAHSQQVGGNWKEVPPDRRVARPGPRLMGLLQPQKGEHQRDEVMLQSCEAIGSVTPGRSNEINVLGTKGSQGEAEMKLQADLRLLADDTPVWGLP
jgi:hypothetical protein